MTTTKTNAPQRKRIRNQRGVPESPASSPLSRRNGLRNSSGLTSSPVGDVAGEATAEEENADEDEAPADGPMTFILSETDVLDCSICYDPLTIPVYQCANGHIACSSCCTNMRNKCPSCSEEIGDKRCLAIERVLESAKISCSYKGYGCQELVSYCDKRSHEEACSCAPCPCPYKACRFRGSPWRLSLHVNQQHKDSVTRICFNSVCSFSFRTEDRFRLLREERAGTLFIFMFTDNSMFIRCFGSSTSGDCRFPYGLIVRRGNSSLRFQSFTEKASEWRDHSPSVDFLKVPGYFFNSGGCLRFDVCIGSKDVCYADISKAIGHAQDAAVGNNNYS